MSAEEREQEPGAQPAPPAAGVSMHDLLASCAAADAVSKPPSDAEADAEDAAVAASRAVVQPAAVDGEGARGGASGRPARDAA